MIESPCVNICMLEPGAKTCVGCGRTIDEIARWSTMTPADRSRVMSELPARLAASKAANAKTATG
jgi:predicted Fe-S protein YdhL (DUF1289 family)